MLLWNPWLLKVRKSKAKVSYSYFSQALLGLAYPWHFLARCIMSHVCNMFAMCLSAQCPSWYQCLAFSPHLLSHLSCPTVTTVGVEPPLTLYLYSISDNFTMSWLDFETWWHECIVLGKGMVVVVELIERDPTSCTESSTDFDTPQWVLQWGDR